jgi:hypothetical protein
MKCCARLNKKLILLIIHAQRDGTHKSENTVFVLPFDISRLADVFGREQD